MKYEVTDFQFSHNYMDFLIYFISILIFELISIYVNHNLQKKIIYNPFINLSFSTYSI